MKQIKLNGALSMDGVKLTNASNTHSIWVDDAFIRKHGQLIERVEDFFHARLNLSFDDVVLLKTLDEANQLLKDLKAINHKGAERIHAHIIMNCTLPCTVHIKKGIPAEAAVVEGIGNYTKCYVLK